MWYNLGTMFVSVSFISGKLLAQVIVVLFSANTVKCSLHRFLFKFKKTCQCYLFLEYTLMYVRMTTESTVHRNVQFNHRVSSLGRGVAILCWFKL